MRKDIFVLIIGYGRTGTSLCVGLLNSSPHLNVGYELNNQIIHLEKAKESLFFEEGLINFDFIFPELSKEFNGNKVVVNSTTSISLMFFLIEKKLAILHDQFKTLKVIFTKRNSVDAMVSRKKRVFGKGIDLSVAELVKDYTVGIFLIERLKKIFTERLVNWYVFDFDAVLENPVDLSQELFDFVGETFEEDYVRKYKGSHNYSHARGVGKENVLFGRDDKFLELRAEINEELVRAERRIGEKKNRY